MDLKQSFSRSFDYKVYPYCCPIKLYLGHVTERKKINYFRSCDFEIYLSFSILYPVDREITKYTLSKS